MKNSYKPLSAVKKFIIVGTASVLCSSFLALPSVSATPGSDFTTAYSATTGTLLTESLWMGVVNNVAGLLNKVAGITAGTSNTIKALVTTDTCDGTMAGAIRYEGGSAQICNGTGWTAMGGAAADEAPTAFSFTDQTLVSPNTTITSNDVVVSGFDGPLTAYCGTNCTGVRRNTGAFASSASGFMPGDTITIRLTSNATPGGTKVANVNLGDTTSANWTVTSDPCNGGTVAGRFPDTNTYPTVRASDGKCWLAKNLGATNIATSKTDANARGWYMQFGRKVDGHEVSTSLTSGTQIPWNSSSDKFILNGADWATGDTNGALRTAAWGPNGANNPCPVNYHVPTKAEFETVIAASPAITTVDTAYSNPLKLVSAGYRHHTLGTISDLDTYTMYETSTTSADRQYILYCGPSCYMNETGIARAMANQVRCIQD